MSLHTQGEKKMNKIRIGSLFAGIGGLELGLEAGLAATGWEAETVWQVEQNEYCRAVLARHWPGAVRYDDVRDIGTSSVPPVDLLCGGFPCQDLSVAGKGAGLEGAKSGLFWEMARIVREIQPRLWIMENVPAITFRGLGDVLGEVARLGYAARWGVLSAEDVGAPHLRRRWFCVAWRPGEVANSDGTGREEQQPPPLTSEMGHTPRRNAETGGEAAPLPGVGRNAPGVPAWLYGHQWPAPPGPQLPHEPPRTRERQPGDRQRLMALGNCVVPQQAAVIGEWVGRALLSRV
jgi:DNA (cytosine-5)-methyltransferase 1